MNTDWREVKQEGNVSANRRVGVSAWRRLISDGRNAIRGRRPVALLRGRVACLRKRDRRGTCVKWPRLGRGRDATLGTRTEAFCRASALHSAERSGLRVMLARGIEKGVIFPAVIVLRVVAQKIVRNGRFGNICPGLGIPEIGYLITCRSFI